MSDELDQIRESMRWLQLPVATEGEGAAVEVAAEEFEQLGVDPADVATWVALELETWRSSGGPSPELAALVVAYINAGDEELGPLLSGSYFRLHAWLSDQPLIDHNAATAALSHARLMVLLASEENLSAAQVARLIATRDSRSAIAWPQVGRILTELGLAPRLSLPEVEAIYAADEALEVEFFADADEATCVALVADAGLRLGFPGDLAVPLRTLVPPDGIAFGPYLQMLHFQCVIAEHYDHALKVLYEFNPRGQTPDWLFGRYPSSLEVAGNPFLNNAKGVDELCYEWARSKKAAQALQAHALVEVIHGLDSMGFAARRELAAWLRRLLVRRIRLARGAEAELPDRLSAKQVKALIDAVASGETGTRGILEQRLVDAVGSFHHQPPDWIARGLFDSVNATNISKRKCGDCDFQNTLDLRVVAYEAHAGKLSDVYVRGHLRTLNNVLRQRLREWEENVGPDLEWQIEVVFVAHDVETVGLPEVDFENVSVKITAVTYHDFLQGFDPADPLTLEAVDRYLRGPLAEARTPDSVRKSLLELLA